MTDDKDVVRPRSRRFAFGLFVFIEFVSLSPLLAMFLSGGGLAGERWRDAGFRNMVVVCCVVPALVALGIVGARRGWNRGALALLGLVGLAWPAFVVWMILHFPNC